MPLWKRGKIYWANVVVAGVRYRQSLETSDRREALAREKELIARIHEGKVAGATGRAYGRLLFNAAAERYQADRVGRVSPRTEQFEKERLKPLKDYFKGRMLARIAAEDIADFQKARIDAHISGRTVNMEVSVLRRMLKKARRWALLAEDVKMFPEVSHIGQAITPEQKATLFRVAGTKPEWMVAHCAAVLAVSTTCRGVELKNLRWQNVDLWERLMTIRRSKTDAGLRVIPLNADAVAALAQLKERSEALIGEVRPEHYVFPTCEKGKLDPTRHQVTWRTAWRALTKEAGLKGLRFHDLRHQAITELAEAGAPDATLKAIAGHVSQRMLEHYSHVRMAAKREVLDKLAGGLIEQPAAEPPQAEAAIAAKVN
jgi:integrase